jgi:uncharacterized protein
LADSLRDLIFRRGREERHETISCDPVQLIAMSNETILVTGASSGIGRELARCFAADGCKVVLVARNADALRSLADELQRTHGVDARVLTADLALPETPARIFEELAEAEGAVDVLVNNAGFGTHGLFLDTPLSRQLDMLQVNLTSLTHLTGLFLPGMIRRRRGGVLNVASTAAFQPGPGMAVYYATKAYVLSFSEALAEELAGSGVTVSALCPGPTKTQFAARADFQGWRPFMKGAASAVEVARCGHRAFRRGRFVAIPGFRNRLLVFLERFCPRSLVRKAVKKLNGVAFASR